MKITKKIIDIEDIEDINGKEKNKKIMKKIYERNLLQLSN